MPQAVFPAVQSTPFQRQPSQAPSIARSQMDRASSAQRADSFDPQPPRPQHAGSVDPFAHLDDSPLYATPAAVHSAPSAELSQQYSPAREYSAEVAIQPAASSELARQYTAEAAQQSHLQAHGQASRFAPAVDDPFAMVFPLEPLQPEPLGAAGSSNDSWGDFEEGAEGTKGAELVAVEVSGLANCFDNKSCAMQERRGKKDDQRAAYYVQLIALCACSSFLEAFSMSVVQCLPHTCCDLLD